MNKYQTGPLYAPPSFAGTLMRPGLIGGANWGGGAFDPDTQRLYVQSTNLPALARLRKGGAGGQTADVDADYVREGATNAEFQDGLPLLKPPYGHLTAIDLNKGEASLAGAVWG